MRRQSMIALGIALVLGVVAAYLANIFLTRTEERVAAVEAGMTRVAVAAVPLDYGVEITPDKVRFVDYPTASLPPGSFNSLAELLPDGKRRVAVRPMMVHEPILAAKLTGEGEGVSLAALLPAGKRAAAVRLNDVSGVAGFVQPNDAVDVLVTRQGAGGDRDGQITDLLLQNIRVIAIDQNARNADGTPVIAKTATLEVDPIEAQKLALAQQIGQLSLVLRKPGEEENDPLIQTVSLQHLRHRVYGARPVVAGSAQPQVNVASAQARPRTVRRTVAAAPVAAAPARPTTNRVEVVRGTQGSDYEVGGYGS